MRSTPQPPLTLLIALVLALAGALPARAASWQFVHGGPRLLTGSAIVEPRRHRLFVYGPLDESRSVVELWSLSLDSLTQWQQVHAPGGGPANRYSSTLLADPAHDRLLFFGGLTSRIFIVSFASDLWELGFTPQPVWHLLADGSGGPSLGSSGSAVLDTRRNRVLAFGGDITYRLTTNSTNLSWEFPDAASGWNSLATTTPPAPRGAAASSYDSTSDRMVVSGGSTGYGGPMSDTWELTFPDSGLWQSLPNTGATPPSAFAAGSWTDAQSHTLDVLNGAATLWALDLSRSDSASWSMRTGIPDPHPGNGPSAWDESGRALWQFDLSNSSLWKFTPDGLPGWSLALPSADNIPARYAGTRLVLDASRDRAELLFGADAPGGAPSTLGARANASSLTGWTSFAVSPSPRSWASVIRDEANDRLIVFGGESGGVALSDLWEYRPATNTWTALSPAGPAPSARSGHSAVIDSVGHRMIVYGGWSQGAPTQTFADTWALSLGPVPTWTRLADAPVALTLHSAVWDAQRHRMLVFGGHFEDGNMIYDSEGLWSYDADSALAWRSVTPQGVGPGLARGHVALIDPARDRMLVFGGNANPGGPMRERQLDLATLTWQPFLTPDAINDDAQNLTGYLDASRARVVLAHARTDGPMELWTLALDDTIPPVAVLVSSAPTPSSLQLVWQLGGDPVPLQLERQKQGGAWTPLAVPVRDASGRVNTLDTDISPGDSLDYRLLGSFGGATTTLATAHTRIPGLVVITPPVNNAISLRAISPAFSVTPEVIVSLPDAAPATLSLYDITGRRVSRSEVGSLGAGQFRVRIVPDRTLDAGLYIARLTRAGRSVSARLVVIP